MASHKYSPEEVDYLVSNVPGRSYRELINLFHKRFGTQLSMNQIKSFIGNRNLNTGCTGRFPKGNVPATKGTHNGGWPPTQFKKGHRPHNWVPLGSERITKDGYIQIKIQEGKFQHNWRGKHILIWEAENGPLPAGHAVLFGDGNRRNFDIDNLLLVSRQQLARLNQNHLIRDDINLTKTGIAIADLCNRIGERSRKRKALI